MLAVETINHESTERTHKQRGYNISRQHYSDYMFVSGKLLVKIQRQQRCQQIEGEEEQKIAHHHLDIIYVP